MNAIIETLPGGILPVQNLVPRCFACGQENPSGLKLRFVKESDTSLCTEFTPPGDWTGWGRMLHGGFHGLLLDEVMAWVAWSLLDVKAFVTREMSVRYIRPAYVGTPLRVIGRLLEDGERDIRTRGEIVDERGQLLTESSGILTRIDPAKMRMML